MEGDKRTSQRAGTTSSSRELCHRDEAPLTTPKCPSLLLMSRTTLSHTLRVPLGTHFLRERHSGVSLYRALRGPGMGTLTESRVTLNVLTLSLHLMAAAGAVD